ncbi:MAG: ribonuclease III domain-containing protein [Oscillibacter sp.]
MYDYTQAKMNDDAIRAISSIGLAHLGDAVYELLVRTYLCVHGKATGKGLHRATVELVCAPQQARFAEKLLPLLTEEEASVFRRGRNANVHSIPTMPTARTIRRPRASRRCSAGCICATITRASTSFSTG